MDRTPTIRASMREVQRTLAIAFGLVIVVVFVFLRSVRAALLPAVAVPVSLAGTFGAMFLLGYSVDNLSLMALTVATGFVVDDAIVVLENIARHVERGMAPREAALRGAREIGFTVVSRSALSLIAVFIPLLLDGRHRRPAVPRVRGRAVGGDPRLDGGVADHDADDGGGAAAARAAARAPHDRARTRARVRAARVCSAAIGAACAGPCATSPSRCRALPARSRSTSRCGSRSRRASSRSRTPG